MIFVHEKIDLERRAKINKKHCNISSNCYQFRYERKYIMALFA